MKASRSALVTSACVVGIPCGKPGYVLSVPSATSSAARGAIVAGLTVWSSSPCRTSTGTPIFLRSSVKSSQYAVISSCWAIAEPFQPGFGPEVAHR